MPTDFNYDFGDAPTEFTSGSQKARVWTEAWVLREMYCPACGSPKLDEFENNKPVADFICGLCDEEYELKSKNGPINKTVPDGAYGTMMARLQSDTKPSLMLLRYDKQSKRVRDLAVIPKQFFLPELIHKRKPLAETARRAGWVGCDIKIDRVPNFGKIKLITNRIARPKDKVVASWKRTAGLRKKSFKQMGWVADVLLCVERIGQAEFTLSDVYKFENYLGELHPENNHVKPKIRQQLQVLRDAGVLEFLGKGVYRVR
ncbi:MAG: DpnI domain-containing protein [Robiginitomaculum sp.]